MPRAIPDTTRPSTIASYDPDRPATGDMRALEKSHKRCEATRFDLRLWGREK